MSRLAPVVITAPSVRSGTTLLQRLFCSSDNTLIYGETCGNDIHQHMQLYSCKALTHMPHEAIRDHNLDKLLAGAVNDWIPDILPPTAGYVDALGTCTAQFISYCRDFAKQQGKDIWGFKVTAWNKAFIELLLLALPRSRVIVMYRDIMDVLPSAKAAGFVSGEEQVRAFVQNWLGTLNGLLELREHPAVTLLDYGDLTGRPEPVLAALEAFTGARNIDRSVLAHRINTVVGNDDRDPTGKGYIQPVELSDAEREITLQIAGPMRAALFHDLPGSPTA